MATAFSIRLIGAAGLALEAFGQLLIGEGVPVLDEAPPPRHIAVAVLVEPQGEHWAEARASGLPIVVVMREQADDSQVLAAVLAGAEAVLHGDTDPSEIVTVLSAVARGGTVLAPAQTRAVASLARAAAAQPTVTLSKREGEILQSIGRGDSVKQTARSLDIAPKTVENIQSRLFRKLNVRNRAQAVARAHDLGLL